MSDDIETHDDDEHEPQIIDAPEPSPVDAADPRLVEALRELGNAYGGIGVAVVAAHMTNKDAVAAQLGAVPGAPNAPTIPPDATMLFRGPPPLMPTPFTVFLDVLGEAEQADPETGQPTGNKVTLWWVNIAVNNAGIHLQLPAPQLVTLVEEISRRVTGGLVGVVPPPPGMMMHGPNRAQRRANDRRR